ncbi:MAG: hypothetical protein AB1489_41580 [Acidobacteriota bacterium]
MNWESYYNKYTTIQDNKSFNTFIREVQDEIANSKDIDLDWPINALSDEKKKRFVAYCFANQIKLPQELFFPMIKAAIYEPCPSSNRSFVEPCIKTFGHRVVNLALLEVLENGTDFEKVGAVNALYWAQVQLTFNFAVTDYKVENATAESQKEYSALSDIRLKKQCLYLKEFINNPNIEVRRSIIASLPLDKDSYPDALKELVDEAIKIARNHSDEYMRHRMEVQLGNVNILEPLPDRNK